MFFNAPKRPRKRLDGISMLEALVVLSIVALATGSAFGLLRQTRVAEPTSLAQKIAARVTQERARAVRSGATIELSESALLPNGDQICSDGSLTFFPDGSVLAGDICTQEDGVQISYRITPIFGNVEASE